MLGQISPKKLPRLLHIPPVLVSGNVTALELKYPDCIYLCLSKDYQGVMTDSSMFVFLFGVKQSLTSSNLKTIEVVKRVLPSLNDPFNPALSLN
jgi:hypothetical protein